MEHCNIEDLLIRYYDGELTSEEIKEAESWINESAENMKLAEQIYYICFASDAIKIQKEIDTDAAMKKVQRQIGANSARRIMHGVQKIAAILLIPFICLSAWLLVDMAKDFNSTIEISSTAGMVSCVTLPDNSRVWLNSGSYLRYPSRFGKERMVKLYGEGYFEVTKDPKHKFIVEAKSSEIVVHGTEFNVESYDDEYIRTTLVSGIVDVNYDNELHHRKSLRLMPSQQAVYNTKTGVMLLSVENVRCNTSWKDGKIVLDNTCLEDALRMIGNKYNVQFIISNPAHRHYKFTGTFSNQSLDVILRYFSISSNIGFRQIDERQSGRDGSAGRSIYEVI
ncbi:MAG: DUF4974 domain-containing protein [Bacteroidales bacterium]|nr:DUF4974 domain-containing protein [Bacteroidales bacterium]